MISKRSKKPVVKPDVSIMIDDRLYVYDADHDCYHRYHMNPISNKRRWIEIGAALLVLTIIIAISRNIS